MISWKIPYNRDALLLKNMNTKRLEKELSSLQEKFSVEPVGDNLALWHLALPGPDKTRYFGGTFLLEFAFPEDYPFGAPKVRFLTKIYHPNVDIKGHICLAVLKDNWRPVITVAKLLEMISNLLANPNPDDPLNVEAAKLYVENPDEYSKRTAEITAKYAI